MHQWDPAVGVHPPMCVSVPSLRDVLTPMVRKPIKYPVHVGKWAARQPLDFFVIPRLQKEVQLDNAHWRKQDRGTYIENRVDATMLALVAPMSEPPLIVATLLYNMDLQIQIHSHRTVQIEHPDVPLIQCRINCTSTQTLIPPLIAVAAMMVVLVCVVLVTLCVITCSVQVHPVAHLAVVVQVYVLLLRVRIMCF